MVSNNLSGPNSKLWSQQYNRHASCINTLSPECYGDAYSQGMEVVDYFARTFQLFRTLDTFTTLSLAGIEPSPDATFSLASVRKALEDYSGGRVVLNCRGPEKDVLHEALYAYFVQGSLQSGTFVPAQTLGVKSSRGNCADSVRYLPKKCKSGTCGRVGEL